ncbi:hypothetical protein HaLaN_11910, partial [Haematococcus lacustris]
GARHIGPSYREPEVDPRCQAPHPVLFLFGRLVRRGKHSCPASQSRKRKAPRSRTGLAAPAPHVVQLTTLSEGATLGVLVT